MRHTSGVILVLALTSTAALVTAAVAGENARLRRTLASPRLQSRVTTFSGQLNGPIASEMRVDGVTYRVAPDVRIFELGRGAMPSGTSYFDRVATVSGVRVRETFIVQSVIVRPAAWSTRGTTGIEPADAPR